LDYNLKGGVLIIGSLFWQNDRDTVDEVRKRWREDRLDINKSIKVSVPIRYARFSKDKTYTTVFDKNLPVTKFGKAKVVPFKDKVTNWGTLRDEVHALSEAEGNGISFIKGDGAWCVCCIVFNKKVSPEKRNDILDQWSEAFKENKVGSDCFLQNGAFYSCTPQGELEIPWPVELKELDFLIATSTQPRNRAGVTDLTVQEITDHVINREYFIPNFLRGIGTCQDKEILARIGSNKELTQLLFKAIIENYELKKREDKNHRYWSWDHCREAFQSDNNDDIKALHLANYLASWGMNRGSGGLLQKDYRIHIVAIEILSNKQYSSLQDHFTKDRIKLLFKLSQDLATHYSSQRYERMGDHYLITPTDTLISKIILGTIGCTPAYDDFFKRGIQITLEKNKQFSRKGIEALFDWIDSFEIQTIRKNLPESAKTLPIMKLLDIYFWSLGYNLSVIEKKT
jgi:hypothetical protein